MSPPTRANLRQPFSARRIPAFLTETPFPPFPPPFRFAFWEEVNSESFFTSAVPHRSFREALHGLQTRILC